MLAFLNGIVSKRTGPQDGEAQGASSICDPLCTGSRSNHWKRIRARTEPIIVSMTPGSAGWYTFTGVVAKTNTGTGMMEVCHPEQDSCAGCGCWKAQTWRSVVTRSRTGADPQRHRSPATGAVQGPEQGTWSCKTVGQDKHTRWNEHPVA